MCDRAMKVIKNLNDNDWRYVRENFASSEQFESVVKPHINQVSRKISCVSDEMQRRAA